MTITLNETQAAAGLAALGNETRLHLFRLLVKAGPEGLSIGGIQRHLGVPASTLAHHIARRCAGKASHSVAQGNRKAPAQASQTYCWSITALAFVCPARGPCNVDLAAPRARGLPHGIRPTARAYAATSGEEPGGESREDEHED